MNPLRSWGIPLALIATLTSTTQAQEPAMLVAGSNRIIVRNAEGAGGCQTFSTLTGARWITPTTWGTLLVSGSSGIREIDASTGEPADPSRPIIITGSSGWGGIVMPRPDRVLVYYNNLQIWEYTYPDGAPIRQFSNDGCNAMVLDPDGNVVTLKGSLLRRLEYPSGTVLMSANTATTAYGSAFMRYGPNGDLYVSDGDGSFAASVWAHNPVTFARRQNPAASGFGLTRPTGLSFHPVTGNLFVVSGSGGTGAYYEFGPNNTFIDVYAPCSPALNSPGSLVFTDEVQFCVQPIEGDLDGDGDVDLQDMAIIIANFGRTCK